MDQNEQEFINDNQTYSIYGDDDHAHEQNSFNKFKRINDYIENHYHDSNDDIDMDGNNIGTIWKFRFSHLLLTCATFHRIQQLKISREHERLWWHGRGCFTYEQ